MSFKRPTRNVSPLNAICTTAPSNCSSQSILQFRTLAKMVVSSPERSLGVIETIDALLRRTHDCLISTAQGAIVPGLDHGQLAEALRHAVATFGPNIELVTEAVETVHPDIATAVYFCCHEALQNAAKHAGRGLALWFSSKPTINASIRSDRQRRWLCLGTNEIGQWP